MNRLFAERQIAAINPKESGSVPTAKRIDQRLGSFDPLMFPNLNRQRHAAQRPLGHVLAVSNATSCRVCQLMECRGTEHLDLIPLDIDRERVESAERIQTRLSIKHRQSESIFLRDCNVINAVHILHRAP